MLRDVSSVIGSYFLLEASGVQIFKKNIGGAVSQQLTFFSPVFPAWLEAGDLFV